MSYKCKQYCYNEEHAYVFLLKDNNKVHQICRDFSLINILSQSCPIKSIEGLEEQSELMTKAR